MAKPVILIIDDEAAIRRLLLKVLAREGYEVLTAASGEEALKMVAERPVDLAIVDMKMPGLNGIETIRQIKNIHTGINFVIITAFGDMASVREAAQLDVFDYVSKPFDLDYIRHLVRYVIGGIRPRTLPYAEYMGQVLSGEMSLDEVNKKKIDSLKEDINRRSRVLRHTQEYAGYTSQYYRESSHKNRFLHKAKKVVTNFYFIIIACGIIVGVIFNYIYAQISSKNIYQSATREKRVTIYDFLQALNELKYWMQKHTEQGMRSERDAIRVPEYPQQGTPEETNAE
ncbi:MAG: response regulator [Candidatus Omnitrophota bacterium]